MLNFFRIYQRYFFLVITVVIIISFSFFGTYSTIDSHPNVWREQVAFKAINGSDITRIEVEEIAQFIGTDRQDKLMYGGAWGPNFLNDGVIQKDFLQTGLAEELIVAFQDQIQKDLAPRLEKEKKFKLYTHPEAPFVGVKSVWEHFSPAMHQSYEALQKTNNAVDKEAVRQRIYLYLGEKQLPASTLRYLLGYQEQLYQWLKPDEKLKYTDLSLFGYHTAEDWFGSRFIRLMSEFIINTAIVAKSQGYEVTRTEAFADLLRNTQLSYQENVKNSNFAVASPEEYFSEQLQRMNLDQGGATRIWQQILLFRRYFQDARNQALLDPLASHKIQDHASQNVTVDLYKLPKELTLANYEQLQNFETYLNSVAKRDSKNMLAIPQQFLTVAEVQKQTPELVQKKYQLEVAKVKKSDLFAKVRLKDLWDWEVEENNWRALVKEFPALGIKNDGARELRFEALEQLDDTTRTKVDAVAKQGILKNHPEWIQESLGNASPEIIVVGLREQGGKMPFEGLDKKVKRQALIQLLDAAPLNENPQVGSPLAVYSPNGEVYYSIKVIERSNQPEILTFAEAQKDGTLDEVKAKALEKYYLAVREQSPATYQKENKEWKPFQSVKETIANEYYENVLRSIQAVQKKAFANDLQKDESKDKLASLRFYDYMRDLQEKIKKSPEESAKWVKNKEEGLLNGISLADQWKIEKETKTLSRQNNEQGADLSGFNTLVVGDWSGVKLSEPGALSFFKISEKGVDSANLEALAKQVRLIQELLGDGARLQLMIQTLQDFTEKNALSLTYLNKAEEEA